MPKNHILKFRITKNQLEQIRNEAQAKGYVAVASYLRDLALKRSGFIESKIVETNENVKKILGALQ